MWTSLNAQKTHQWHIYNSRTNRTGTFNFEVEAIKWIEESYNPIPDANKKFWFFSRSSTLEVLNKQ